MNVYLRPPFDVKIDIFSRLQRHKAPNNLKLFIAFVDIFNANIFYRTTFYRTTLPRPLKLRLFKTPIALSVLRVKASDISINRNVIIDVII